MIVPRHIWITSITAPDKPLATTADDKTNKIEYKLKTSLPTINKTITVIDASKVTMATYKQNDSYNTILMYDGQPFGYVTTDKDDNMVNNVTTYYIQKFKRTIRKVIILCYDDLILII